ncbi:MAG: hypothetical protein RLZZ502_208 [Pseudomonadota bacterium]|jgi:hypothetical protein
MNQTQVVQELRDVVKVIPVDRYVLQLTFDNKEVKYFDFSYLLETKPFIQLGNKHLFSQAFIQNGTVCWPGDIDIDPEILYQKSTPQSEYLWRLDFQNTVGAKLAIPGIENIPDSVFDLPYKSEMPRPVEF